MYGIFDFSSGDAFRKIESGKMEFFETIKPEVWRFQRMSCGLCFYLELCLDLKGVRS